MGPDRPRPIGIGSARELAFLDSRWRLLTVIAWALIAAYMLFYKWHAIQWFSLGDTDDNMRFLQVHDWLHGQGWYDLRQHRMNPPAGASIHWTRLVDLPIAAIVLLVRPFAGEHDAWYVAVAAAPLLPLGVALFALGATVRRLVDRSAALLGALLIVPGIAAMMMFMPLRIDHHNWQLACLGWSIAGIADPKRVRGGVTLGLASAASITIGLELVPYALMAAAVTALVWVWDRGQARRLLALGASLAGGCALGFVVFASFDNRAAVCDALSPVWLSVTALGGGLLVALALVPARSVWGRLALALLAGAMVVAFYATAWPKCVSPHLEGMSPELQKLWFSHVREAKPLYAQPWRIALGVIGLPLSGLVGAFIATWSNRGRPTFAPWAAIALFALFAALLLLWQTRSGPAAELLAVPGAAWLAWHALPPLFNHRWLLVRVLGTVGAAMLISGLWTFFIENLIPQRHVPQPAGRAAASRDRLCPTLPAMAELERFPAQTIFTFVDLGPRIIATTHHSVVAGPYHRNGGAILDVHHAFRGTPAIAHDAMLRHGATLLLICPGSSESTIYRAEAPKGFYSQLVNGQVPTWLQPVTLPANSPFELWRRVG